MLLYTYLRKLLWAGMQVGMNIQRRVSSGDFADSKTNILKLRAHTYTEPLLWLFSQNQYAL